MGLAVVGLDSLDKLEEMVVANFKDIKNKDVALPDYSFPFPRYQTHKPQLRSELLHGLVNADHAERAADCDASADATDTY